METTVEQTKIGIVPINGASEADGTIFLNTKSTEVLRKLLIVIQFLEGRMEIFFFFYTNFLLYCIHF